jgi:2-methylcitrate dehydratase PrpD
VFDEAVSRLRALRYDDFTDDAANVGRQCLLDWLGCALAGSGEPLSGILQAEVVDAGPCTVVGTGLHASAAAAALANGAAGHALDFDDTHSAMTGHPSAPVAPAVLALAEETDAAGEDLLVSYVTGVEVECRLGAYLGEEHYRVGWHSTGTLGTVGAAAACARLIGLDEVSWGHALALAVTQAAGLKASFGTMAKPFHAGRAAANGLLAARLAARGFTGAPGAVDAPQGFLEAAAGGKGEDDRLDDLAGRFLVRDTLFKHHAACYLTHAAINAASSLRGSVDADAIEKVDVRVHPSLLGVCAIAEPATGLELKFSLRATTAMALLGLDTADLASFTDEMAHDARLVGLRDRVTVTTDRVMSATRAVVTVDGRQAEDDTGRPAADLDLQGKRLVAKFEALARPVVGTAKAEALVDLVRRVERLSSLRPLFEATHP